MSRSFSVTVKLTAAADHQIGRYSGQEISVESRSAQSQAANRSVPWHYRDVLEGLSAGDYLLRAVVRDDETGQLGSYDAKVRIPALAGAYSNSTLFLTSRYGPVKDPESATLFLAGGAGLAPMSRAGCQRGQKLAIVYEIYNVARAQLERPPAVKALLTKQGEALETNITGQFTSDARLKRLRFIGYLDSSALEPGAYELTLEAIGQPGDAKNRLLRRSFDVR